ncbi:hypothetical protein [Citrifermentans bemidjiense]|nr:hypothetical protein [Citrifermentans bemidjiense]
MTYQPDEQVIGSSASMTVKTTGNRVVNPSSQTARYKTQWCAQFYAAAELTRRGYLVSMTFGNATASDLIVQSPGGYPFTVDVKGQSTKNFWLIQRRPDNAAHYFILVYLPPAFEPPRFFVLSCSQLMGHRAEYEQASTVRGKYRDDLGGMNWSTALSHEGQWEILPE